jgi:hypothetical protein
MRRRTLIAAIALALAACQPPVRPSAFPTEQASATPSLSIRTAAPVASASAEPAQAACDDFPVEYDAHPIMLLGPADAPTDAYWGLNGTSVIGGSLHPRGPWHQPSTRQMQMIEPGEPLRLSARFDPDEISGKIIETLCLDSVRVDVAPLSQVAAIPDRSTLVRLASSDGRVDGLTFDAPIEPGDWVLRVVADFATEPGPTRQESFFRLLVGLPYPAVEGRTSVAASCSPPGARAPRILLVAEGQDPVAGETYAMSWRGTDSHGGFAEGPRVQAEDGSELVIRVEGRVCAGGWRIERGPRPPGVYHGFEPLAEVVPSHDGLEDAMSAANRFELGPLPHAHWVIQAHFTFADSGSEFVGDVATAWNVVVAP